ncbi:DNA translocase FtsK [Roseisalinus antarcticus]|uniref:DNA translocase FtsK n=1 Tax=Roseisalinus antarcticus TaxID=254357 RepID=A0A1Y5SKM0_9RHOB|nr:DNA translocase FtsK [Roseisalinus antarcticus]SLN42961.1 DNA translocase FtsK [Roseisalinus antarcticus]
MAYQTRQRDPLLDSTTQAALERRGQELFGIVLVVAGLAVLAMIWSYTPDDPSWITATDAPVQNWLGRGGAAAAAPLFTIVGWGGLGIAAVLIGWGLRFTFHKGQERALGRAIFFPIAVAFVSIYASTLTPYESWTLTFGLGGMFGDTALSIALMVIPVGPLLGVKIMSGVIGLSTVALALFVLGFTGDEVRSGIRFLVRSVVLAYAALLRLLARVSGAGLSGASAAVTAARAARARRADARAGDAEAMTHELPEVDAPSPADRVAAVIRARRTTAAVADAAPVIEAPDSPAPETRAPPERTGLLARMPSLMRRADPALAEPEDDRPEPEDRIRSKVSDIIKARVRGAPLTATPAVRAATAQRHRGPKPLLIQAGPHAGLPEEPPVTGGARLASQPETETESEQSALMSRVRAASQRAPAPQEAEDLADAEMPSPELVDGPMPEPRGYDTPTHAQPGRPIMRRTTDEAPTPPVAEPARPVVQHAAKRSVKPSRQAMAEAQPGLAFADSEHAYEIPPLGLLTSPDTVERHHLAKEALEENARMLENVLDDYGVKGDIVSVRPGPVVTMYELEPAPGLKASRVIGLADDIARSMSALSARVSTVPGRSVIGIELPNEKRETVVLREMLSSRDFGDGNHKLPLALGKDIGGDPVIANLAKMPHLLIAGTTGSGKSVAINTMILSLLYKLRPEECRLIMIDPKMLELSVYDGIPHLLSPVVTDPKKAVVALKWTVGEMEDRYRKMSKLGVRNIEGYNSRVEDALAKGETFSRTVQTGFDDETGDPVFETEEITPEAMPYIVVIVDEMADLMMVAGKEIEACIQRLAQMARASGIHIIMATQRPSVDVITGTIKANFPTRISFQVTSKVDSRTILGEQGAEQLLGQGDMLYMAGGAKITRVHGPFVSDEEVEEIVNHLKQFGPPDYKSGVVEGPDEDKGSDIDAVLGLTSGGNGDAEDALYDTAVHIVAKDRKCSTSYIQRKLAIGYNKAARLVEQMEDEGVVSAANHVGKREVLVPEP